MLRFTSKCSLLLLAVMPRWAYADLECDSDGWLIGYLIDPSKCHVEDVNRAFGVEVDKCWATNNYVSDRRCTVC